jgi:hypothetical protein
MQKIPEDQDKYCPNLKRHKYISYTKSIIRIIGYITLPFSIIGAMLFLLLAELLGIIEEFK